MPAVDLARGSPLKRQSEHDLIAVRGLHSIPAKARHHGGPSFYAHTFYRFALIFCMVPFNLPEIGAIREPTQP
ncbi:hypothetical protein [Paracoccus alcaliphilus]|uniref:hypothetical protein n=1 Tax=Paracoccus alcaliphilus TaxID=34002 RepID=UPI001113CECB|nr:hypothetical protein [Paracoccus alcaliphilus]WCR17142.1 hypothetical protein JHW40_12230 [Paracoccus alcaliphilus]